MNGDARVLLLDWLMHQTGKPYIWGGKGEFVKLATGELVEGYDCSGLVTVGLRLHGFKDCPHGSGNLSDKLEPTDDPHPLDLVFYGPPKGINHTMFFWGDGRVFGACGGNKYIATPLQAAKRKACVQFRSKVLYRPDFRGYRRIPLH